MPGTDCTQLALACVLSISRYSPDGLGTTLTAAGLDPSYVAGLENGRRDPPRQEILDRLCEALALKPIERDRLQRAALASRLKKVWSETSGAPGLANLLAKLAMALPVLNAAERTAIKTLVGACMRHHQHNTEGEAI